MFKIPRWIMGWMAMGLAATAAAQAADVPAAKPVSIYDLKVEPMKADGHSSPTLKPYAGKVMLIVNVASKCGNTPQYAGLEAMYRENKDRGLVLLGFPCNQFGGQEPGTEAQIAEFCKANYDVSFPIYGKIDVKGEKMSPLYALLTGPAGPEPGDVKWNFEKFLIGRDGKVLARFRSKVKPGDPALVAAVEKALAAPDPAKDPHAGHAH